MSLILKQEPANTISTPPAGKSTLFITDTSTMAVKNPAGDVTYFPTVQGSNTQVLFNDNGGINGNASLVFNKTTGTMTVANLSVTGTLNAGDISVSSIANGSSNVDIIGVSGNVTTSVGGVANVLVVTNTGANITGNLSMTGNITALNINGNVTGNISGNATSAVTAGTVTTAAQPNITSVGTLTSVSVSGNANIGNIGTAGLITATGNLNAGNIITGGSISATGNANVGNIGAASGVFTTVAGSLTTASQPNVTSVGTLTSVSVSGNATVGNIIGSHANGNSNVNIATINGNVTITSAGNTTITVTGTGANISGTLSASGNANVGNLGTGGLITATGNINGGNIITSGIVSATGNGTFGNVSATTFTGALSGAATTAGTVTTAAQPNITSVGTLTGLGVNGTLTAVNITANTGVLTGNGNGLSSLVGANVTGQVSFAATANAVAGANVSGQVGNALVAGTVYTNAQPNITSVGILTGVSVSGNAAVGNVSATNHTGTTANLTGQYITTLATGTAPFVVTSTTQVANLNVATAGLATFATTANAVAGANVSGTVSSATTAGTVTTAAQPNITSVGTLTSVSVSGNATVGNISATNHTGTTVSVTGNVTGGNLTTGGILSVTGVGVSSIAGNLNMNGNWLTNVGYAVANTDAASKQYVDTMVSSGISYHAPVYVATTTTLATATGGTTAYNSPNGAANGIGAYISTTGTFLNIDGFNVQSVGRRILVKDEANATWNGIYTYSNTTAIVRAVDADQYGPDSTEQFSINDYFFTQNGTTNEGVAFIVSAPSGVITFGTSNITFSTFSTSQVYDAGTGINISGTTISANASQTQITAVGTLTTLSVSGNANVGNIGAAAGVFTTVAGSLTTAAQPNITSLGTLTSLSVTGNINSANVTATHYGAATGLTGIPGANVTGTVPLATSSTTAGTVTTAAQGNITSVGTLTSLNSSGTITAPAFTANTGVFTGNGSGLSAIAGANVTGTVSSATTAGTVTTAAQGNITSVGTLTSLSVSGNITAGNISATNHTGTTSNITGQYITTLATGTAPFVVTSTTQVANLNVASAGLATFATTANAVAGANVSGTVSSATTAGTVTTAAQPNITSVTSSGGAFTVGNTSNGGVYVSRDNLVFNSYTGAPEGGQIVLAWAGISGLTGQGNSSWNMDSDGSNSYRLFWQNATGSTGVPFTAYSTNNSVLFGNNIFVTSGVTASTLTSNVATGTAPFTVTSTTQVANLNVATAGTAGTVTTAAQPNITSLGTMTGMSYANASTITGNNITFSTGANTNLGTFTGNFSLSAGSRLNATYADLAEKYVADAEYQPGTVLVFGGEQEVTLSTESDSFRVAGVVTTDPAYTMNNECEGEHVATIALQGRVPVKVIGPVFKGDLLVSCGNGHAIANNIARAGTIIGKSLENFSEATGIIEVAVGRF